MTTEEVSAKMEEMMLEVKSELAAQKEQIKGALKRIDEQAALTQSVHELATSVKLLANEQKGLSEKVNDTNKKLNSVASEVDKIKMKPAQKYEDIAKTVVTIIVTAAVTFMITKLGF